MISVIVATYNQEDTIARTLDSILAQQCSWPVEILIGDDHSTDGTPQICREYLQRISGTRNLWISGNKNLGDGGFSLRYFYREQNIGVVDNYFGCLLEAKGKYIADCAGDDEWCDPLKLEKELRILEEHEDVVLVHTDYRLRIAETGDFRKALPYPFRKGISEGKDLLVSNFIQAERPAAHLCTSLYRNSTFHECYKQYTQYFKGRTYPCEDLQLSTLFATKGKFVYLDEITLNYSVGGNSISNKASYEKQWHFVEGCTRLRYDLAKTLGLLDDTRIQENLSYQFYILMMHSMRTHNREQRKETLALAKSMNVRVNGKTKLLRALTSNRLTWSLLLAARAVYVSFKHF